MTKYLDENGLLYLWGKLKATFLHNASEGRFTGVSTNTSTGLRTFNVPTIAEHIYYDSNKNSTLKDKIDTIVSQGGEPNTIETIKVNGTALTVTDKAVNITFTDNDTKNTAGSTNSNSKLYLIGATSLAANPQTYSRAAVYVGTDGKLRSGFGVNSATDAQSIVATASDLSGKADKVSGGTTGNLVALDSNGNIVDSGQSASSVLSSIKVDGISGSTINRYGVCSTSADTAAKTVNVTGGTFNLETGAQVIVNFSNINTANNPTLNVNSTGAKSIYVDGTQITTNEVGVLNGVCNLVYDGTKWNLVGKYLVNDIGDYVDSIVERISENCITRSGKTNDEEDFLANAVLTVPYTVGQTTATAPIRIGESAVEMGQDGQILITNETSDTTGSPTTRVRINLTQVYAPLADATFSSVSIVDGTNSQVLMADGSIKTLDVANGIATTSYVTNALGNITGITYEVVQTLPASGSAGTIYLISNSGTNPNIYDEYIYVNNGFEKIGTTDVDLTGYWSKTELVVIPNTTIDYIVANNALPTT